MLIGTWGGLVRNVLYTRWGSSNLIIIGAPTRVGGVWQPLISTKFMSVFNHRGLYRKLISDSRMRNVRLFGGHLANTGGIS